MAFLGDEFADDGTTVSTARRVGSFSCNPGAGQGDRIAWTVSEGRWWHAMADRRGPVGRWTARGDPNSA